MFFSKLSSFIVILVASGILVASDSQLGQFGDDHEMAAQDKTETHQEPEVTDETVRFKKLSQDMSGVKFVGNFTVSGRETKLAPEEYFILRTDKLDNEDYWTITARIKYGEHDLTVPMTMEIKWAGETPVITVDQMTIPGFGTFDARVIVHEGQYSGTWKHGEVGGHLFGEIIKLSDEELQDLKQKAGRRRAAGDDGKKDDGKKDDGPNPNNGNKSGQ